MHPTIHPWRKELAFKIYRKGVDKRNRRIRVIQLKTDQTIFSKIPLPKVSLQDGCMKGWMHPSIQGCKRDQRKNLKNNIFITQYKAIRTLDFNSTAIFSFKFFLKHVLNLIQKYNKN